MCWRIAGERAVGRDLVVEPPGAEVVDQLVEVVVGDLVEVAVVDLEARRLGAGREALDVLDGEHAVGVVPPALMPRRLLGVLEQLLAAEQQAGDVGADVDEVAPDRLALEHLVERAVPSTSAGVTPTSSAMCSMASSVT